MALAGKIGRRGRLFVEEEVTFGTLVNATAGGAFRHLDFGGQYNPFNRVDSEEKKQSPGNVNEHDRRATAGWDLKSAYLIPSGTLNTLCEANKFLEHALGSKRSVTLSTTASTGLSTTGATLASGTGLAVGDMVLINLTGGSAPGRYVRRLTSVAGAAVTWTGQPLPSAIQAGNTVKGGVTYSLISGEAAKSLSISHYIDATIKRAWVGCVIEQLKLMFNANDDYKFAASGPAVEQIPSAGVASAPGTFTTVGGKPVSGISGRLEVGTAMTAYKALKAEYSLANGYAMRNESLGFTKAEEFYREAARRTVGLALDARVEDPTAIYDPSITGTAIPIMLTAGLTEGQIFAVYTPLARFDVPDTPDGTGALTWSFSAKCLESADGANDEIIVGAF